MRGLGNADLGTGEPANFVDLGPTLPNDTLKRTKH